MSNVIVKENGNTLAEAVFALTEDALSMDMTIYTEDVTSDVDIVIKKNSFTYTVVLDGQYKILDMEAILEDGAITSFKFDYNDYYTSLDYVYDEELDEWVEVPLVIFEDAIEIKYIGGGNVHKIQFEYYGYSGDVVFRIGDDQKSVSAEAVVVYEEYNWEDEANPIVHTIFDGSFSIGYSYENGVGSITVSLDVDDLVTEGYDWEEFEDSDEWYWIFYFEKCIYDFDGELTFSFKIG